MRYVRENFIDQLNPASCFWQIGIVDNQAAWIAIIRPAIVPELYELTHDQIITRVTPINRSIVH